MKMLFSFLSLHNSYIVLQIHYNEYTTTAIIDYRPMFNSLLSFRGKKKQQTNVPLGFCFVVNL